MRKKSITSNFKGWNFRDWRISYLFIGKYSKFTLHQRRKLLRLETRNRKYRISPRISKLSIRRISSFLTCLIECLELMLLLLELSTKSKKCFSTIGRPVSSILELGFPTDQPLSSSILEILDLCIVFNLLQK